MASNAKINLFVNGELVGSTISSGDSRAVDLDVSQAILKGSNTRRSLRETLGIGLAGTGL